MERRRAAHRRGRRLDPERGEEGQAVGHLLRPARPTSTTATAVSDTRVEITLTEPDSLDRRRDRLLGQRRARARLRARPRVGGHLRQRRQGRRLGQRRAVHADRRAGRARATPWTGSTSYPLVEGGKPSPAKVVYRVFPDVNTEILALQSGEVDVIANALPPAQVETAAQAPTGITVAEVAGPRLRAHDVQHDEAGPGEDSRCARRSPHAVDYDAIRNVVLQGQAVSTGSSPLMPVLKRLLRPVDQGVRRSTPSVSRAAAWRRPATRPTASGNFPSSFRLIYSLQDASPRQWAHAGEGRRGQGRHHDRAAGHWSATPIWRRPTTATSTSTRATSPSWTTRSTNLTLSYLPGGAINYTLRRRLRRSTTLIDEGAVTTDQADRRSSSCARRRRSCTTRCTTT